MATFSEILTDVYTLTNRPDLVAESKLAVRAATLKVHATDFYYKDITELPVDLGVSEFLHTLDYKDIFPRYKALSYIRKLDITTTDNQDVFFTVLTPNEVLDPYSANRADVAYVAGANLQLRGSTKFRYVSIGAYQYPDVTEDSYNSWIAIEYPFTIIHIAAANVFAGIGLREEANSQMSMAGNLITDLKMTNIQAEGY
jgi:hypothetical protein